MDYPVETTSFFRAAKANGINFNMRLIERPVIAMLEKMERNHH
ncbi:MAG: hypothetical protein ACREKL_12470 [Chthoniobacterales bacterium]